MPEMVNELLPLVWSLPELPETMSLTRLKLPYEAQANLARWSQEKSGRAELSMTTILRGLSEILAWFVPEIAFMRHEKEFPDDATRFCMYFAGRGRATPEIRKRLQAGMAMWLNVLFADKNSQIRRVLADSPLEDSNWKELEVTTALEAQGVTCGVPKNRMLFDAATVMAVEALAGKIVKFQSEEEKVLLPKSAQPNPYGGIELVAFPPKRSSNGDGFWSEVVTISTANFPERPGIHILARSSIRNWGTVTRYTASNDRSRSLDIFIPASMCTPSGLSHRHSSLEFRVKLNGGRQLQGERELIACWGCDDNQRLTELLRRLTGSKPLDGKALVSPVIEEDGLWLLPRLASGHGDKYLPGGTGVPWPDKRNIGESLDAAFKPIGGTRAEPMTRTSPVRIAIDRPFGANMEESAAWPMRRRALRTALEALGKRDGIWEILIFHRIEQTPELIADQVRQLLGPPDREKKLQLSWKDGLSVHIRSYPAGPLSESLPEAELTSEEKAQNSKQQREILRFKREELIRSSAVSMAEHIRRARGAADNIASALLEMPSELQNNPWRDPYAMAKRELAKQNVLTQVILIDGESDTEKYFASLRDCLRMLGVPPIEEISGLDYMPAALTIIQRNESVVGGGRIKGQAFPVAARIRSGILECAIPEESGEPQWMTYGNAALRILAGNYGRFGRDRKEETQAKFRSFFSNAIEQIDKCGASVIIAEMETISHRLSTLQNAHLVFDEFHIGNDIYRPSDVPNVRIARTSPDPEKQPHYYHTTGVKWPSGIFNWGNARRTAYTLKAKPPSVAHKSSFASQTSRHGLTDQGQNSERTARVAPQIDEICIAFMQPGDDPMKLISFVHRLRGTHSQYKYDTVKPYPLHEISRLGGGVTE